MSIRSIAGSALLVAWLAAGCGLAAPPSVPAATSSEPHPQLTTPGVSEEEITEATSVRTRFGLRADEAWIETVATEPEAQAGISEFGIPLMPYELADLMGRRWSDNLLSQVEGYGLLFPDDFAGAYINLKGSGVIIEFKDQVERHRRALTNLVADPALVEVRQVEWSLRDLEQFTEQVQADRAWFDTIGVQFLQVDHRVNQNFVHVDFVGPTAGAARAIEAHFGNPTWLKAEWDGPPQWTGPRADLVIKITNAEGRPVANIWCEVIPEDPSVRHGGDTIFGTGPDGICELKSLPAVAYQVRLHEWIANDHYDPEPVTEFRVVLPSTGKIVRVALPAS